MPFAFVCVHTFLCKELSSGISSSDITKIRVIVLTVLHLDNLIFERSNTPPQLPKIRLWIHKSILLYTILTYVTVPPHFPKNPLKVMVQMQHCDENFLYPEIDLSHCFVCYYWELLGKMGKVFLFPCWNMLLWGTPMGLWLKSQSL